MGRLLHENKVYDGLKLDFEQEFLVPPDNDNYEQFIEYAKLKMMIIIAQQLEIISESIQKCGNIYR